MWLWNCSNNLALFGCLLDFGTIPTVWNYLFIYWTLELFQYCGIKNEKNNNATLLEQFQSPIVKQIMPHSLISSKVEIPIMPHYRNSSKVHYLLFNWTLELFRECGIIGFSFCYWTLGLFTQCSIIDVSIGLWNSVRTVSKSHFKKIMPHCRNSSKVQ
jgi:hypothetical protein